ncbi:MAG: DUF58 domain-containing protein [Firmicutes bacterium]|nr:DUF58 domain-containing protein [Bacillota bacterium]
MRLTFHIVITIVLGYLAVFYANPIMCTLCGVWLMMIPVGIWLCRATRDDLNILFTAPNYVGAIGEPCTLSLKIENCSDRPVGKIKLYLQYFHQYEKKIYKIPVITKIGGGEMTWLEVQISSDLVGIAECSLHRWQVWDPLGIMSLKEKGLSKATVAFLPEIFPVRLQLPESFVGSEGEGEDTNPQRGGENNSEVFQIREYRPGDRPQSIHWKLSARVDDLMVREYSRFVQSKAALIFDMSAPDFTDLNEMFSLGISIAFAMLENDAKFYIAWYHSDQNHMERMLVEQEEHVYEALSCLFQAPVYESQTPISDVYKRFFPEEHVQLCVNRRLELLYNGKVAHQFVKENLANQIKEIEI